MLKEKEWLKFLNSMIYEVIDPGTGNTGTSILYFPAMTEGHIPHIIADETETSRVSGSVFDAVNI